MFHQKWHITILLLFYGTYQNIYNICNYGDSPRKHIGHDLKYVYIFLRHNETHIQILFLSYMVSWVSLWFIPHLFAFDVVHSFSFLHRLTLQGSLLHFRHSQLLSCLPFTNNLFLYSSFLPSLTRIAPPFFNSCELPFASSLHVIPWSQQPCSTTCQPNYLLFFLS